MAYPENVQLFQVLEELRKQGFLKVVSLGLQRCTLCHLREQWNLKGGVGQCYHVRMAKSPASFFCSRAQAFTSRLNDLEIHHTTGVKLKLASFTSLPIKSVNKKDQECLASRDPTVLEIWRSVALLVPRCPERQLLLWVMCNRSNTPPPKHSWTATVSTSAQAVHASAQAVCRMHLA